MSETEIKLFQPLKVLKLFQNYLSDTEHAGKYSWAETILWKNIRQVSMRWNKIISDGRRQRLK